MAKPTNQDAIRNRAAIAARATRQRNADQRARLAVKRYNQERSTRIRNQHAYRRSLVEQQRRDREAADEADRDLLGQDFGYSPAQVPFDVRLREVNAAGLRITPAGPYKSLRSGFFAPASTDLDDALDVATSKWNDAPGLGTLSPLADPTLRVTWVDEDGDAREESVRITYWGGAFRMPKDLGELPPDAIYQVIVTERVRGNNTP